MILTVAGLIMAVISVFDGNVPVMVIGIVLLMFGMAFTKAVVRGSHARYNRDRWWAYGEEPTWTKKVG